MYPTEAIFGHLLIHLSALESVSYDPILSTPSSQRWYLSNKI